MDYCSMVKANEDFFFPNGSVPVVSQFISWLNLDLGIEVCMDWMATECLPFLLTCSCSWVVLLWAAATLCGFAGCVALMLSQH